MRDFCFQTPTKVYFGRNVNENIGPELKKKKIRKILLAAGGNSKNPNLLRLYRQVEDRIREADIEIVKFYGVKPNPSLAQAKEGITLAKQEKVDAVMAIGGGSTIDPAKCIAAGALYEGDVWDFYMGKEKIRRALPVYAVLTLSGTGSENNGNSVISDKESGIKKLLVSGCFYPQAAFVNPEIQMSVPDRVFSSCCFDAMCHVMEHYFDGGEAPEVSNAIGEALLRTFVSEVPKVLKNPGDIAARSAVMWASSLALDGVPSIAGLGGKGGDWSSHNLETGLSIMKDSSHGAGLAVLFPAWLEYIKEDQIEKAARFAAEVFGIRDGSVSERADAGIRALREFIASIGCPESLEEFGVTEEDIPRLVEIISVFTPMGRAKRLYEKDVERILRMAL